MSDVPLVHRAQQSIQSGHALILDQGICQQSYDLGSWELGAKAMVASLSVSHGGVRCRIIIVVVATTCHLLSNLTSGMIRRTNPTVRLSHFARKSHFHSDCVGFETLDLVRSFGAK